MNITCIVGNLTKDPEIRYTKSEIAVCNFTVAVSRKFKKDEADYFDVIVWREHGENCAKYLSKGKKVSVVGEMQSRIWEDKNGTKHKVWELVAEQVDFLSPKDGKPATTEISEPDENDDSLPF